MHRFSEIVLTSPCAFKIDLTDGYARETARRQRAFGKRTVGRLLRLPNIPEYSEVQGNLDAVSGSQSSPQVSPFTAVPAVPDHETARRPVELGWVKGPVSSFGVSLYR